MNNYNQFYTKSISNPNDFWQEQADELDWFSKPTVVLSKDENGYPMWFKDGMLNMCYLTIDKHIQDGFGNQVAMIYDSPVTQTVKKFTLQLKKLQLL